MPESLTRKTPGGELVHPKRGGRHRLGTVAGFSSESWPASNRNTGRHQIGIPGRNASESAVNAPDANARYSSFDSSRTALAEFIFGCILLHLKALNNDFCGP